MVIMGNKVIMLKYAEESSKGVSSPVKYIMYSENIFQEAFENTRINNIRYADDTVLIADSMNHLQYLVKVMEEQEHNKVENLIHTARNRIEMSQVVANISFVYFLERPNNNYLNWSNIRLDIAKVDPIHKMGQHFAIFVSL